jgi:hypothetical protein
VKGEDEAERRDTVFKVCDVTVLSGKSTVCVEYERQNIIL